MQGPLIVTIIVIISVTFVAGVILLIRQYEKARTERLRALAKDLGLDFHPVANSAVMDRISHFGLFNHGHGRKTMNMICGETEDIQLAVFGYRYSTGGGQQQQVHTQTVISFQSPELALPEFALWPETVFSRIGQAFGSQDIDFESHPSFSRKYVLRGRCEKRSVLWIAPVT